MAQFTFTPPPDNFREDIEMLKNTDPNSNTLFNNVLQKIIDNEAYLLKRVNENYHYVGNVLVINNVASLYPDSPTNVGTIKIKLPRYNFMFQMNVKIRSYNACYEYILGGYTYIGTSAWHGCQVGITGGWCTPNINKSVRFAVDGNGDRYILIANTSTDWGGYLQVVIPELIVGFSSTVQLASGWNISLVTSETGLTTQSTPIINQNM